MGKIAETFFNFRRPRATVEDVLNARAKRGLEPDGVAPVSPVPMQPPIGYRKQPSMAEIIRAQVRDALDAHARENEMETLEDADDFDVGDDDDLDDRRSGYENDLDPPLEELLAAGRQALAEKEKQGGAGDRPREQPKPPEAAPKPPEGASDKLPSVTP